MPVRIGFLREPAPEGRVALVPEVCARLMKKGAEIVGEQGAGTGAHFPDEAYEGVRFADRTSVLEGSDVLLTVLPPDLDAVDGLRPDSVLAGFMHPHRQTELVRRLCVKRITAFAMELIPRISRAQSMDALSSQASIAGYRAVLIAAGLLDKFFPMLTTAAGTIRPARALVIGAGVAGLQAIATARRLGAIVEAYDVRAATREQVESLGAKFVDTGVSAEGSGGYARELTDEERTSQQEKLAERIAAADVVITTAAVPGRQAPRIITRAMVEAMRPGSIIVDLAAEGGGNCELTRAGETVTHADVRIEGPLDVASSMARNASEMYARNLYHFISPALSDGALAIDWEDEVFAGSVLTRGGEIVHAATREALGS